MEHIVYSFLQENILLVIASIIILTFLSVILNYKLKGIGFILSLLVYGACYFVVDNLTGFIICVLPALVLSLIIITLTDNKNKKETKNSPFKVELITNKNEKIYVEDIDKGTAIFGASGAGKSASAIYFYLKHFADNDFAGIIYDYKDFELTEIAYPLFQKKGIDFHVFALHDINRSLRVNPIAPEYMKTENDINGIVSTLVLNLGQSEDTSDGGKFFRDGTESLMAAVVWRLKTEYPEKCNLPFVVAFLLSAENHHEKIETDNGQMLVNPYKKLVDWICKDQRAEILGSVFLSGLSNPKQTAALYSTLAAALRKIASPSSFYLLEKNDIPLDINSDHNRKVISIINEPGTAENSYSPILATVADSFLTHMSKRNRKPAFTLIDEAPTIKIMNLARRVATLRSYGMAFVYCAQDKIQLVAQYQGKEYLAQQILTNLSTIFMGKVNDPKTAKYYEEYFAFIEKDQTSISKGKSDFFSTSDKGGTRETTSKKEQRKYRAQDFFQLKAGEFIMMRGGVDERFRFFYDEDAEQKKTYPNREITPTELEDNYLRILNEAKNFLK